MSAFKSQMFSECIVEEILELQLSNLNDNCCGFLLTLITTVHRFNSVSGTLDCPKHMGYAQLYTVHDIVKNASPQGLKGATSKMSNPNQLVCKASGETIHRISYGYFVG